MHDALAVRFVQSIRDLDSDLQHLLDWERPLLQPLGQSLAFQVLHHQEVNAVLVADVV